MISRDDFNASCTREYSKGYAGIAVKRPFHNGYLIRPLLGVTKEEIVNYCNELK